MFLKTRNFIKKRLQHRCCEVCETFGNTFFSQNISDGCFCLFWNEKVKMKKCIHMNIFTGKHQWWVFFSTVAALRVYNFTKKGLHIRCFCEICEVLQKAAWRMLPISSNILGISLALLAINQLSHDWLSV